MTQPPLSRQIQLLEHELGVELLLRGRGIVRLTPAGKAFLPEAQDLLRRSEAAALTARRAIRGDAGIVSLGFIPACSYGFLPSIVAAARTCLPDIDLNLKEMTTSDQCEAIAAGRLDLGLVRPIEARAGLETVCVMTDPFVLALPAKHALANKRDPSIHDLHGLPFIMYSPAEGRYSYEMLAGVFRLSGVEPRYVQYLFQTHTILSLVSAGLGVALVPKSSQRLAWSDIAFRTVDIGGAAAELHLASRTAVENPVVTRFRAFILSQMRS